MCPLLEEGLGSGHEGSSIEPLDNRTIDGETASRERCSTRRREQAVLDERQNLELFTQLASGSLLIASWVSLVNLSIPGRRGNPEHSCRYSAQERC